MAITDPLLSDEELRTLRDNEPTLSDRQGIDLGAKLNAKFAEFASEFAARPSGEATVLNTTDNVVVSDPSLANLDGSPVVAVLGEADGAIHVLSVAWDGSDNLTITLSAAVTADRTVYWSVNGG